MKKCSTFARFARSHPTPGLGSQAGVGSEVGVQWVTSESGGSRASRAETYVYVCESEVPTRESADVSDASRKFQLGSWWT